MNNEEILLANKVTMFSSVGYFAAANLSHRLATTPEAMIATQEHRLPWDGQTSVATHGGAIKIDFFCEIFQVVN